MVPPDGAPPPPDRRRLRHLALQFGLPLLLLAGLVFAFVAAQETLARTEGRRLPGVGALAAAIALAGLAQFCGARAWGALLPAATDRWAVARSYHLSQPAKYVPGGFGQGASHVALTTRTGATLGAASVAWVTLQIAVVSTALALGSGLAFADDLRPLLRAICGVGGLGIVLLYRPLLIAGLRVLRRVVRRVPAEGHVPAQTRIVVAALWHAAFTVLHGSALWALLFGLDAGVALPRSVAGYGFALAIGILAVPVPSGVGVREAVLVAVLPSTAAVTISAAICHRLVTMAVELAAIGANLVVGRLIGRSRG